MDDLYYDQRRHCQAGQASRHSQHTNGGGQYDAPSYVFGQRQKAGVEVQAYSLPFRTSPRAGVNRSGPVSKPHSRVEVSLDSDNLMRTQAIGVTGVGILNGLSSRRLAIELYQRSPRRNAPS